MCKEKYNMISPMGFIRQKYNMISLMGKNLSPRADGNSFLEDVIVILGLKARSV